MPRDEQACINLQQPVALRFWARVQKTDGCWLWTGAATKGGYGTFRFNGRTQYVHRIAFQAERGEVPAGLVLDHLCCTRLCVRPEHLEPVKQADNVRRGRLARLTIEDVFTVRRRVAAGETQVSVARALGVPKQTINSIVRGQSWRGVAGKS